MPRKAILMANIHQYGVIYFQVMRKLYLIIEVSIRLNVSFNIDFLVVCLTNLKMKT